jgi:3-oxoacyl-[acyl-carrier-protein] synthase II
MNRKRVVITGVGAVSPIGIGADEFWAALTAGRNGVAPVSHFDASEYRSKLAAEVKNFDPVNWIDSKSARRMDPFTQFAVAASVMAMEDAGLPTEPFDGTRAGVIIGSGIGGAQTIEDGYEILNNKGPNSLNPFLVSMLLVNMAASMVSIRFGLKGPMAALSVACSTGANAIGDAYHIIERGDADIMLAGGSEACITPLAYGGFCATRSMSQNTDPASASRPFDKNRDGFVMGEGAGITVLESLEHARARGARVYAELAGYGNTADAYHFTAPEPSGDGMKRVMRVALNDAGMAPEDIDYVNAHGTSTTLNDKSETSAIMDVFGAHASKLKVSSNKSMIGHLMAAAGAVEFVSSVLTVYNGVIPPTINYSEPDPDCPLDYVANGAETMKVRAAISNSFGFGGGNSSVIAKEYSETS